jgi:hypothetical protein
MPQFQMHQRIQDPPISLLAIIQLTQNLTHRRS